MDEMMESKIYVCPMHPDETSDKPGTCSICGMDLVLMEDTEEMEESEDSDM